MYALDLITDEDVDEAPGEPIAAFLFLIKKAKERARQVMDRLPNDEDGWRETQGLQYQYMNTVSGYAKAYGIEALSNYIIPTFNGFRDFDYQQFNSDVEHFLAQVRVQVAQESKARNIGLSDDTKAKMRSYLEHIRDLIGNSDLPDERKSYLFHKIEEFQAELDKAQFNFTVVSSFAMALHSAPWGDPKIVNSLGGKIWKEFGEARERQAVVQLLEKKKPLKLALSPPRPAEEKQESFGRVPDIDGEFPF